MGEQRDDGHWMDGQIEGAVEAEDVAKRREGDIEAPEPRIGKEEDEELLVGIANAVAQPGAVMVHVHHAHLVFTWFGY